MRKALLILFAFGLVILIGVQRYAIAQGYNVPFVPHTVATPTLLYFNGFEASASTGCTGASTPWACCGASPPGTATCNCTNDDNVECVGANDPYPCCDAGTGVGHCGALGTTSSATNCESSDALTGSEAVQDTSGGSTAFNEWDDILDTGLTDFWVKFNLKITSESGAPSGTDIRFTTTGGGDNGLQIGWTANDDISMFCGNTPSGKTVSNTTVTATWGTYKIHFDQSAGDATLYCTMSGATACQGMSTPATDGVCNGATSTNTTYGWRIRGVNSTDDWTVDNFAIYDIDPD